MENNYSINTKCVQGGYTPGNGEPRQIPIYQSTTFKYDTSEDMGKLFDLEADGYFYTRLANPTNDYVAAKIAELEGGTAAMLTSSGQAANFFALFNICENGSHIVSSASIYGGTFNLIEVTMKKMGIDVTFVEPDCTEEELNAAFKENTRAVFGESIANPALTVLDIEKFAKAAHAHGVPLIVDNTFPTPVNLRPIEWGADIVTHSTTETMLYAMLDILESADITIPMSTGSCLSLLYNNFPESTDRPDIMAARKKEAISIGTNNVFILFRSVKINRLNIYSLYILSKEKTHIILLKKPAS